MLVTHYVFLDTEVFVRARFDFEAGILRRVSDLVATGRLGLVMPEVSLREIQHKLEDHVENAFTALSKLRRQAPALGALQINGAPLLPAVERDTISNEMLARWQAYSALTVKNRLELADGTLATVLDAYFARRPPFGNGDKKYQFIDALAVEALDQWCTQGGAQVYVISADPDLESACAQREHLHYLKEPSELLELVAITNDMAAALVLRTQDRIKELTRAELPDLWFHLEDEDGDVENVVVMSLELGEPAIQDVTGATVRFGIPAVATVQADVSYGRSDNAVYDSEDKRLIFWDRAEHKIEQDVDLQILGTIEAEDETLGSAEDVAVEFDSSVVLSVYAHPEYYE